MAKSLLFQKEYNEALLLHNRLLGLQFLVIDRDIGEYNEMELEDVIGEGLITLNFKEIVLNLMYAIYQIDDGKDRAAELYGYLTWDMSKDIKIEVSLFSSKDGLYEIYFSYDILYQLILIPAGGEGGKQSC